MANCVCACTYNNIEDYEAQEAAKNDSLHRETAE